MKNTRPLFGLIALLIGATGPVIRTAASAQEQTPGTAPPTSTPVLRRAHMDPKHPLNIGSDYYPKQSVKHREQGTCYMAFLVKADGSVPAAQLLKSSGYPLLDVACIKSVIDVPMLPATIDGSPVTSWTDFPITWVIGHPLPTAHLPLDRSAVPRVSEGYELQVGDKFYPEAARAKGQKGYCVVHTIVDTTGAVRDLRISHSTGSPILDKACTDAITPARFAPELQNGLAVEVSTDIAIYR